MMAFFPAWDGLVHFVKLVSTQECINSYIYLMARLVRLLPTDQISNSQFDICLGFALFFGVRSSSVLYYCTILCISLAVYDNFAIAKLSDPSKLPKPTLYTYIIPSQKIAKYSRRFCDPHLNMVLALRPWFPLLPLASPTTQYWINPFILHRCIHLMHLDNVYTSRVSIPQ